MHGTFIYCIKLWFCLTSLLGVGFWGYPAACSDYMIRDFVIGWWFRIFSYPAHLWKRVCYTEIMLISGCFADLELLKTEGNNKLHVTIGSALDVFGGGMKYKDVLDFIKRSKEDVNC